MAVHCISNPIVKAAFESYPQEIGDSLRDLRALIFEVADALKDLGPIEETLTRGLPCYRLAEAGGEAGIRIGPAPKADSDYAIFLPDKAPIIERFEELYPGMFRIEDNGALVFSIGEVLPDMPLRHCIALALTCHLHDGVDVAQLEAVEA